MRRLVVLTKSDQVNGFRLAGINAIAVDHVQDVTQMISDWLAKKEEILLAVDDSFFSALDPALLDKIYKSDDMLVVTIPDGPVSSADEARKKRIFEMIRHATGVQIHFKGESHDN